jgi:arylsulfatase A-like enzyme
LFIRKLKKVRSFFCVSILVSLILIPGCRKSQNQANFILITLDTQRADYIGAINPGLDLSPHIDAIAQEGTIFENCFSPIPITLPAHAIIYYSMLPQDLDLYNNGQVLNKVENKPSFAKVFQEKGYTTGAFISLGVLKDKFGLNEGFDVYDAYFPVGEFYFNAEEVNNKVFPWLDQVKEDNFFAWVHYSDPHAPYHPPDMTPEIRIFLNDEFTGECQLNKRIHQIDCRLNSGLNRIKFELQYDPSEIADLKNPAFIDKLDVLKVQDKSPYEYELKSGFNQDEKNRIDIVENTAYFEVLNSGEPCKAEILVRGRIVRKKSANKKYYGAEVRYMDRQIGKLIEKLRDLQLFDKTYILMVGDHGEGLGEYINYAGNGDFGHVNFLYKVYTHVPLIIYNPFGKGKSARIAEPVSLLDVAPTIMGLMGFEQLPHFQGRDLFKDKKEMDYRIFLQTHTPQAEKDIFAFVSYPWHLIFVPELRGFELFDLEKDPVETNDIFNEGDLPEGITSLQRELVAKARSVLETKTTVTIDDKSEEMLRALGYIK